MTWDYLGLVLKDIKRRKFSSFLTLFAISLGILTIFVVVLLSQGFEQSIEKQFDQFGANRLYVTSTASGFGPTATSGLSDNEINLVQNKPYVNEVYPYYFRSAQIEHSKKFKKTTVLGSTLSSEFYEDLNVNIEFGRAPKENEKFAMVIGSKAAADLFDKELDVGSNVYIKGTKFKVVGIMESLGNPEDDSQLQVQIDTLRDLFEDGDNVGIMDVLIVEGYDIQTAKENLQIFLDNRLGEDTTEVISPDQFLDQLSSILDIVNYTLGGIAFVALLVGAFGIVNTMYVIITEKTKDIGIMKSIGATNRKILIMYMFQAGVFGLLGAIIGVILGSFAALGFGAVAQASGFSFLEITIDFTLAFMLLIFGFSIGLFSGFLPAYKASKLNVVECLRK